MDYKITRLIDRPEMKEEMAKWFHEKWDVPLEAYIESMDECLLNRNPVPQWCGRCFVELCLCRYERKGNCCSVSCD